MIELNPYYLVITDEETGIELPRVKFYIDIAIVNNLIFRRLKSGRT